MKSFPTLGCQAAETQKPEGRPSKKIQTARPHPAFAAAPAKAQNTNPTPDPQKVTKLDELPANTQDATPTPAPEMETEPDEVVADAAKPKTIKFKETFGQARARIKGSNLESKELSERERERRRMLEEEVISGLLSYRKMGLALKDIRDEKLFRDTHETFEDYLDDVYGFKPSRASQLISFTDDVTEIEAKLIETTDKTADEIEAMLPINESHTRAMKKLPLDDKIAVLTEVLKGKDASSATAKDFKDARMKLFPVLEKKLKTDPRVKVIATLKGHEVEVEAQRVQEEEDCTLELTGSCNSTEELRSALSQLAGKSLSKAIKKMIAAEEQQAD